MPKNPDPMATALARMRSDPPPADRPVLLAGPTASGKSALAQALAQDQGRVVINADALQVHDMWHILSARPSVAEMGDIPHFLYGCVGRGQDWSVGHWVRAVAGLLPRYPNAVIVGGTGLYFRALTEGLAEIPAIPAEIRREGDRRRASDDLSTMVNELDAPTRARIDTANPARVQRAWEVLNATGQGLVAWQAQTPPPLVPLSAANAIVLRPPIEWLNSRIAARFDAMMRDGAMEEARAALPHWDPSAPWAKAIGAPELIAHLQGHMLLGEAVHAATLATRQYAKRQRTWFRSRMSAWQSLC